MIASLLAAAALSWAMSDGPRVAQRDPDRPPVTLAQQTSFDPDRSHAVPRESLAEEAAASLEAAGDSTHQALKPVVGERLPAALESPIARALRVIEECQARYDAISDYVCTFTKRERIDGKLKAPHVMLMKARTKPRSIYLKFRQPAAGREAIYIAGQHQDKVLAHDVGLGRLIAGTLRLDPLGSRAMADCRHPITEAGIGPLLDTLEARWTSELDSRETRVGFQDEATVASRQCSVITVAHTVRDSRFMFHKVQLYIDDELGLPIHFEAYDWPASPDTTAELLEEYTYANLKLNVGLGDIDFDINNSSYRFGRF